MAKFELQDFVQFGQLFECYGALLSDDRQKIMKAYFEFNETLAEIAEERNISRQAVLDAIEKSCEKLRSFEQALGLCAKRQKFAKDLSEILQNLKTSSKKLKSFEQVCAQKKQQIESEDNKFANFETKTIALESTIEKVENILKEI